MTNEIEKTIEELEKRSQVSLEEQMMLPKKVNT